MENIPLLRQTDRYSDGPLTVENLILAMQDDVESIVVDFSLTKRIRAHHLKLMECNYPHMHFAYRQQKNISYYAKSKIYQLSFDAQINDHRCFGFARRIYNKVAMIPTFRHISISEIDIRRMFGGSNITFLVTSVGLSFHPEAINLFLKAVLKVIRLK